MDAMVICFACSIYRFGMCSRSSRYRNSGLFFFLSRRCPVGSRVEEKHETPTAVYSNPQILVPVEFATCQRIRLRRFILCTKSCSVYNKHPPRFFTNYQHAIIYRKPMYIVVLYVPYTMCICTSPSLHPSRPSSRKRPTPPTAHHRNDRL